MKDKNKKNKKEKEKKSKKKRKHQETKLHETGSSSTDLVTVSLDASIASSPGCSWGSVFAAAARIVPAEGADDEDFLRRTESTHVDPGLAKMSALAASSKHVQTETKDETSVQGSETSHTSERSEKSRTETKHFKRQRQGSSSHSSQEEPTLLGRMVPHPDTLEQFMVLVDSHRHVVYSAMNRTPSGEHVRLGTLQKGEIVWDEHAFSQDEKDEASGPDLPFPTDPDDHCESPLESYRDILPFLEQLCNGSKDEFAIYDPYYCDGAVKRNLAELGFRRVHNEKQDCYRVWSTGSEPSYQVLVTNPPYSEHHIPQLLEHVTNPNFGDRPWFLLLPNWVHKKDYYKSVTAKIRPFYLVPKKRYVYLPPKQFREKKASDVHKKSSPFLSMWYIWGGSTQQNEELIQHYINGGDRPCDLVRSRSALRDLRRKGQKKNRT